MKKYTADDVIILSTSEVIRTRPSMYVGSTKNPSSLFWGLVHNALSEVVNYAGSTVIVTMHEDSQGATIEDNGGGFPLVKHPISGDTAIEILFTKMLCGTPQYKNGFLRIGITDPTLCMINALCVSLGVDFYREGGHYRITFKCGEVDQPLTRIGDTDKTGTKISFRPDPEIFESTKLDVVHNLPDKIYTTPQVRLIVFTVIIGGISRVCYTANLVNLIKHIVPEETHSEIKFYHYCEETILVEIALCRSEGSRIFSYVNSVKTPNGGSHEEALRELLPATGYTAVISVFTHHPKFKSAQDLIVEDLELKAWILDKLRGDVNDW